MDKYGALQAPRLPSSSSRRSIASDASRGPASAIASGSGAGLRKRDVARHELEMLQREEAERRDAYAHQVDGVNVHTLPAMPPRPRRTSNHSTSSHHYRQAPMLQPQGRQLSSGSIPSQQQQQYNAWEPPQRSHATHERRTKRSGSNVSRTSTVLSAGLARRAVAAAAAAVDEPRTQPGSQSAIGQNLHAFDPRRYLRDQDGHSGARPQDSPLRRWVRLIEKTGRRETKRGHAREWAVALAAIVWVKWAVGIGGWSGKGHPPLYGDMEAQRHWLSLTNHLPLKRWYYHDLSYWGLDYPPLTAYHSYLLGRIAIIFGDPRWVELKGRLGGNEEVFREEKAVLFMRSTVILGDLLLWALPVALWCLVATGRLTKAGVGDKTKSRRSARTMMIAFYTIMLQPGLILIDSGHFQYNSIMLGLTLLAVLCMHSGRDALGAALFVCSMCFKQMAIYYAPGIFAYLLGKCFWTGGSEGLNLFVALGFFSTATLLAIFAPFLYPPSLAGQALHRIFPFARGLFEDKVANFWCSLNVVVKLRELASIPTLARISALVTLAATIPIVAGVVWVSAQLREESTASTQVKQSADASQTPSSTPNTADTRKHVTISGPAPTIKLLPYALFASAMAFFLFSFQVHEKTILLPLMPLTLLIAGKQPGLAGSDFEWAVLLNNIGCFSMYPLLRRDGIALPSIALVLFWNFAIGYNPLSLAPSVVKYLSIAAYFGAIVITFLESFSTPPSHLPDLFVVLNVVMSCGLFGLGWLWSLTRLMEESWGLVGLGIGKSDGIALSQLQHEPFAVAPSFSRMSRSGSEYSIADRRSPSPLTAGSLSVLDNGGRDFHQRRSASVASSSRTATRRHRRSPLLSPDELPEESDSYPPPISHQTLRPEAAQHRRTSSSSTYASKSSSYNAPRHRDRSPNLGDMSTHVSPSKTIVPTSNASRSSRHDRIGNEQSLASEEDRWRKATLGDFD